MPTKRKTPTKPPVKKPVKKAAPKKKPPVKKPVKKTVKKAAPKKPAKKAAPRKTAKKENVVMGFLKARHIQLIAGLAIFAAGWIFFTPQKDSPSMFESMKQRAAASIRMQQGR